MEKKSFLVSGFRYLFQKLKFLEKKALAEERKYSTQLEEEKQDFQKKIDAVELKLEAALADKRTYEKQVADLELSKKVLQSSIENLTSSRDNARNLHAASEKEKNSLQVQLNDSRRLISELEDETHQLEASVAAANEALRSSKEQHSRDVAARDEKLEAAKSAFSKLERDSKLTLDEEKKRSQQLTTANKNLESRIAALLAESDEANYRAEEQQKVIRKYQSQLSQLKEVQAELAEMNDVKNSLLKKSLENDKKIKSVEAENSTLVEQVQNLERQKRAVEEELKEVRSEMNTLKNQYQSAITAEKKNFEARLSELQDELSEEKSINNDNEQYIRKLTKDLETATSKLAEQKALVKETEAAKSRLEQVNKELETSKALLDSTYREKLRENAVTLEQRMAKLELALESEVKERESLVKQLKKTEKDLGDVEADLLEAKDGEDAAKNQLEKVLKKFENLRRENAEQADTITRLTQAKLALQCDVEEKEEQLDQFKKELVRKDAYGSKASSRSRSRMERVDDDYDLDE
ncbi:myosin heavy chain, embryonic smooth muscle isoform isoform X3 [Hydra vulgaris]|uniref:Myosin heavy chain, embryonic smooth muscle isoform isoform X3 n=1 Tax=Hydra vulgaris TaxID=6087 RepID=A0ABM4CE48_HYDVU